MMTLMGDVNTFINGDYTTVEKAYLHIEDRGMLFGDGIYEFARCYVDGIPFQMEEHLQRLKNSAKAIDLELPYTGPEIKDIVGELLEKCGAKQAGIYIQATRGLNMPRTHHFPRVVKPSFFIIVRELEPEPPEFMVDGVKAILLPDQRWTRCDIKSLNLLPNILAKEKAVREGAYEAIFYRDFGVTEGSSSSVFAVFDGRIYTTPAGEWILPGVTSHTVVQLASRAGYSVHFEFIPREKLYKADELFITSSRLDIVPVSTLYDTPIGSGKPGPLTRALKEAFQAFARGQA